MHTTGPAPYFQLAGTARQALEHWQQVFGGEVQIATYADFSRTDGPADAVAHGQLTGELQLFAADASEGDTPFSATGCSSHCSAPRNRTSCVGGSTSSPRAARSSTRCSSARGAIGTAPSATRTGSPG